MPSRSRALVLLLLIVALAAALPLAFTPDSILAESTGLTSPTTDISYGGDGFEVSPTNAYADDGLTAQNINGPGHSHDYYNYGFSIPAGATIKGIEVRLDWYLDSDNGTNSMGIALSWNGGGNWTAAQTDNVESIVEHTTVLGGLTDTWGRLWNPGEFSNSSFRVRVTCSSDDPARDFYLDWVAVNVHYAPVAWLQVSGSSTMTAGTANQLTVTAMDNEGNVAVNYSGSKTLVFSGPGTAPDGDIPTTDGVPIGNNISLTFTNGACTTTLIAYKAETTTVDVAEGAINSYGSPAYDLDVTVNPATASRLEVTGPASMTAGSNNELAVTAKDSYGNTDINYTGLKSLTFSGPGISPGGQTPTVELVNVGLAVTVNFTNGVSDAGAVTLTAYRAEVTTVEVTDGIVSSTGYGLNLAVSPGPTTRLDLTPNGGPATAGVPFTVTATAQDPYLNVTPSYASTVTFSSSDNATGVVLPAPYPFGPSDNGAHEYTNGVTLITAGSQTLTASDGTLSDITTWDVSPSGTADHIVISPAAATIVAGDNVTYAVEAFDVYNNSLGDVTSGTVFSIDLSAGGSWSANVYVSQYAGPWTVTGDYSGIVGTASLTVQPGPASSIIITPDSPSVAAGGSVTYIAQAFDQFDNSAGDVTGSTAFSIEAPAGGSWLNNVYTPQYAGQWTVTGDYSGITDTDILTVTAGSAVSIVITPGMASIAAGESISYTVQAVDQFNNPLSDATAITVFSIDAAAGGTWAANVYTSQYSGIWTVTGDCEGIPGTASLTVGAGAISSYAVTSDNYSLETSIAFTVTVTAYDAYGNVATGDNTTVVTMSSTSPTMIFDGNGNGLFGESGDNTKTLSGGTFDIQAKDNTAAEGITITASDGSFQATSEAYTVENFRCFIATAAYGTPMAGEIQVLRDFRDKYLLANPPGRLFVSAYYKLSPPVARFIADHDALRAGIRLGLTPLLWLASAALNATLVQKLAFLALALVAALVTAVRLRRIRRARTA